MPAGGRTVFQGTGHGRPRSQVAIQRQEFLLRAVRCLAVVRVQADVPLLGYAVVELQRPAGWLVLLGMIAMLYASGVLLRGGKPAGGPRSSSGVGRA